MTATHSDTAILVDPNATGVGVDLAGLLTAARRLSAGDPVVVPGLASHPELLTGAVKAAGARKAVVVTTDLEHPTLAELRTWGAAGGLDPLGVQVVALDILGARRSGTERSAYALRMIRAALAALDSPRTAAAGRRRLGSSLSRRALLRGCATTWVPVVAVQAAACLGTARCSSCVQSCPEGALQVTPNVLSAAPMVDASRCTACSGCLDVCPTGALSLDGHQPATLVRQLRALLAGGDGGPAPALIISCRDAAERLHGLGQSAGLPGWLSLEVDCLGGVGSTWHLAALAAGARAVQVLPCTGCRERGTPATDVGFTRSLLAALGDADAARRVAILPEKAGRLRRAIRAAEDLLALVDGTGADGMTGLDAIETPGQGTSRLSARVAGWAVGELQLALASPLQHPDGQPVVIHGEGAPLGVPRTTPGCTACGVCTRGCPTQALSLATGPGSTELVLDPGACNGCRVCVSTCPEGVLEVVAGVDLHLLAGGCVPIARAAAASCLDCGENVPAMPAVPAGPRLIPLPAALAGRCPSCRQAALLAQGA